MAEHNDTGKKGEELAVGHLLKNGFSILETNWRFRHLEVDIIAMKNNMLVFLEVKTRFSSAFGAPEEFVDKTKQRNLRTAANAYVQTKNMDLEVRFDIISILMKKDQAPAIHHLEDAFLF
mgnify:CR=1 FL=1